MAREKIIYLVDDDEDDRMLIREAMEGVVKGVEVIECADGERFLEVIKETSFSESERVMLILMDMSMPRLNGLETLARLRANPAFEHWPVLMVSTASDRKLIAEAYAKGVNAFIVKPVFTDEFQQMAEGINDCFFNNSQSVPYQLPIRKSSPTDVLFVEDNKDHWELIDMALKQMMPGIRATGTMTFTSTMDLLRSKLERGEALPQLILLDLYLPTRDEGLKLLDAIRELQLDYGLVPIPVVVVSYSDHQEDIQESYRHKANAYLIKTMDLSEWMSYFNELCNFWCGTITLPRAVAC